MNNTHLDCKGLPCPQPVLQCKQHIDVHQPEAVSIAVDNEAALQNVTRFLENQGYQVGNVQTAQNEWRVTAARAADAQAENAPVPQTAASHLDPKTLIFLTAPGVGEGDTVLGEKLMLNFLATLPEMGPQLWRIILVNGAVRLAVQGSPCLEALQKLEAAGVTILVCGTCLTHFDLLDKKAVGQTTNMLDVVTSLQLAGKVIRP
ncbi:sulfurtransferase-like selenium metabolism protein YedF [Desulfonatronum sp. SC1]|uniref:sulfurtransferase-like selenium metabolism protein YedF n=1 Tax=Desulfonatronum sp. SC1 TaxID=2109626 RepID=UPI000D30B02D|nr:sulfurtransferase-like selenium metabolism protein YedF [Desulfonatronum sp. SC1]PTN32884.1 sulfurtransferase-like selenium metabolism protein YedF [Desulfonatronum sp. SC1]